MIRKMTRDITERVIRECSSAFASRKTSQESAAYCYRYCPTRNENDQNNWKNHHPNCVSLYNKRIDKSTRVFLVPLYETRMSSSALSFWDFVDPSKPWVLGDGKVAFEGFSNFIPVHYRHGPWHVGTNLVLGALAYLLILAATWMRMNPPTESGSWMSMYHIEDEQYEPFTNAWYAHFVVFLWMAYICWNVLFLSPMGKVAWITFTLWSWTTVTLRHGLLVLAPWVTSARVPAEILRFPGLLSASIVTAVWNFVLFPAIALFYIKDAEQRKTFVSYFLNFRLTQLHVFNIIFAIANGVLLEPRRPLHLGDFAAAVTMLVLYMLFYFCVLDRLGVHIYPIFSPRTPIAIPSLLLVIGACVGGFNFWRGILSPP